MDRDVYISISGLHQMQDGEGNDSDIELVSPARYYRRGGKQFVAYKEQYTMDMHSHNATLRVEDGSVMVSSKGEMGGQLHFEPGKRNMTVYETPFGCLQMGVTTQSLRMNLQEHNWEIDVDYSIDIDNMYSGDHQVHIKVQDGKGEKKISLSDGA